MWKKTFEFVDYCLPKLTIVQHHTSSVHIFRVYSPDNSWGSSYVSENAILQTQHDDVVLRVLDTSKEACCTATPPWPLLVKRQWTKDTYPSWTTEDSSPQRQHSQRPTSTLLSFTDRAVLNRCYSIRTTQPPWRASREHLVLPFNLWMVNRGNPSMPYILLLVVVRQIDTSTRAHVSQYNTATLKETYLYWYLLENQSHSM